MNDITDQYSSLHSQSEEAKEAVLNSTSTLSKAIEHAKRLSTQDRFDQNAKIGFLKLIAKDLLQPIDLDEN